MRILIATDAWYPQVNGVVRTLESTANELKLAGHDVLMLTHEGRWSMPLPSYGEIRLALISVQKAGRIIEEFRPDAIHIATEGTIGMAVRRWCVRHEIPFTTGFHTRFAEFAAARIPLPGVTALGYRFLRWFHRGSGAVMAPTPAVADDLSHLGFSNVKVWTRGVKHDIFKPYAEKMFTDLKRPIFINAGRVAVEKGLEDFLSADLPGTKVVIGDGPDKGKLERKYPDAVFTGYLFNEHLGQAIASADVFVFPSKVDTFGLVMIEAMACGVPVAAYPVYGPKDVVKHGESGILDKDLKTAALEALNIDRDAARAYALTFTWERTAEIFYSLLVPVNPNQTTLRGGAKGMQGV